MSHATCVVTVPAKRAEDWQDYLEEILQPYDENRTVAPYPDFEEGGPEDYWFVRACRRDAVAHAADSPIEVNAMRNAEGLIWVNGEGHVTAERYVEIEKRKRAQYAQSAEELGDSPTWERVIEVYRKHYLTYYPDDNSVDDDEALRYDPETDRAFTWSTYNPQSRWDWWSVGGRWLGYFDVTDEGRKLLGDDPGDAHKIDEDAPLDVRLAVSLLRHNIGPQGTDLIVGVPGTGDNDREPYKVDGGRVRLLDIDGMRARAADRRGEAWDAWQKRVEGTPEAVLWEQYIAQVTAGKITIEEARTQYHGQPRMVRLKETTTDSWESWDGYSVDVMQLPREQAVELARAQAIPGYATIDLEGRWLEAGKMGWWGMGEDRIGAVVPYLEVADAAISALDPDDLLVVIDYHI